MTNCQVLGEGFDLPKIDALVMARPTMSPGLYVQQLGQGMRPAEGKDDCLVLDLTGRAGLIDARQIRLPDIIGVADGDGFEQGRDRRKTGPRSLLMDPYGEARWAWGWSPGRFGKIYYAGIAQGVHSALVPDGHGSGLYHAFVAGQNLSPALQRVSLRPVPLREAVATVEVSLTRSGFAGYLAHRDRRWRDDGPTERQLAYLGRFDRAQAARAEAEGWTKGDVSTAIVGHEVLGLLRRKRVV